MENRLELGKWNAICDVCGFKFKNTDLRKNWRGLMVCEKDYETRNEQDYLRVRPERGAAPWVRTEAPDYFIPFLYACTPETSRAIAGQGLVGCMITGKS